MIWKIDNVSCVLKNILKFFPFVMWETSLNTITLSLGFPNPKGNYTLHVILPHESEITHNITPRRTINCVGNRNQVSFYYVIKRKIYIMVHQIIAMHIDANEVIFKH
jgi:hypothetical protein